MAGIAGSSGCGRKMSSRLRSDRSLCGGLRAIVAGKAGARDRCMIKPDISRPSRGDVARVAGVRRSKMRGRLARHLGVVVAAKAGGRRFCMGKCGGCPSCGLMTGLASIRRAEMRGRLAGGFRAVVAAEAGAGGRRMIKGNGLPAGGDVAILADICGGKMCGRLAEGRWLGARMAGEAGANSRCMIEVLHGNRLPHGKAHVAIVTGVRRGKMRGRLARGSSAIMATEARAGCHATMIKARGLPGNRALVAVRANIVRSHMRRRLARGINAVVTGKAGSRNIGMAEPRGLPGRGGMAVIAAIGRLQMGWRLACCNTAIMTVKTRAADLCMVNFDRRRPNRHTMAG